MFKINHVLASSLDSNLHHFSSASLLTASEMALFLAFLSHDIFSTWQPESSLTLFRSSAFLLKIPEWLFHSKSLQEATNDSTVCSLLIPWPPPRQLVSSSLLPLLTLFQHSCLLVIYGTGQIFCSCYFFFPGILFTVDTLMAHLLHNPHAPLPPVGRWTLVSLNSSMHVMSAMATLEFLSLHQRQTGLLRAYIKFLGEILTDPVRTWRRKGKRKEYSASLAHYCSCKHRLQDLCVCVCVCVLHRADPPEGPGHP